MGIFRFENKYSAPAREQRERYMKGEYEEHRFGADEEILLVLYDEAAYLKDDTDGVRILFTGTADKAKVHDELRRLLDEHEARRQRPDEFRTGRER
jgi:hypothetical protein